MNAPGRLRIVSERDLAILGLKDLAYVAHVVVDGKPAYSIHAAEGTTIGVTADRDLAFAAVRRHDLEPLSVH